MYSKKEKIRTRKNSESEHFFHSVAVYKFIGTMIGKNKYCNDAMKIHFNTELVMTKQGNEDLENSCKCWICDVYVDGDVKVRDHCHITRKYNVLCIDLVISRLN